jgi:hypothetical protein
MADNLSAKMKAFADIIEGRVVHDEGRVQVCIKGTVLGFPATYEAIGAGFPFGGNYFIETKVIDDPNQEPDKRALNLTALPRVARGLLQILARIMLFEAKGQSVGDKRLEKMFIFSHNNRGEAERFVTYPGVFERLIEIHNYTKFTELLVKADAGLWLAQSENFKSLTPDLFRETFNVLGALGQNVFDAF